MKEMGPGGASKNGGPSGEGGSNIKCPGGNTRIKCTQGKLYLYRPPNIEIDTFIDRTSYTMCYQSNWTSRKFEMECRQEPTGTQNTRKCCGVVALRVAEESSQSTFNCTFMSRMQKYTMLFSVRQSDCNESTTVRNTDRTDSTTAAWKTTGVKSTPQKTTSYVTTLKQTEPISTKAHTTSATSTSITSSTRELLPSTRLATDNTVKATGKMKTTGKMNTPAPFRGDGIPVAVAVPLTLILLLVALVVFVRWKKDRKGFCTKSRRNLNPSQTSTLNPDGSAPALIVNPTYDLDGRLTDDVTHQASLAGVQEEARTYAEIPPREYEAYRPGENSASYTALQKFRSPGSEDNWDDDSLVYTPIPVNDKPAKHGEADSDYVEPDTVLQHPGDGASAPVDSSTPNHKEPHTDAKRQGKHRDVPSPSPKSSGYVDVDAPPLVFSETPAASKMSAYEPQDQVSTGDPDGVYYFKLQRHSQDTPGELDRELSDPSAADSGQYHSLEASAKLPLDTKLADEGDDYDVISRNATNLAKTAANATSSTYNHVVIPAAAHSNGANNAYDTVERPLSKTALKCGDVQHGATGGNIYSSTSHEGKTAAYDVIERPGMKHSINTTEEGDYSMAMPVV